MNLSPFRLLILSLLFFPLIEIEAADEIDTEWKKTAPVKSRMKKHTKDIYSIVIHHTETPNEAARLAKNRLQNIQSYHIREKKWGDIAYHYLIDPSGKIYEGRDSAFQGDSGTDYDLNGRLLICVLGSFTEQLPTAPALDSLVQFVKAKAKNLHLDVKQHVTTHRDVASTDCPGKTFHKWLTEGGITTHSSTKTKNSNARAHYFPLGKDTFQLEIPSDFKKLESSKKEDLYQIRVESEDGKAQFGITMKTPRSDNLVWPSLKKGEVITTEEENRLATTGPGKSYTRYLHRSVWGKQEHSVIWEFKVDTTEALEQYREAYSAFKKSLSTKSDLRSAR